MGLLAQSLTDVECHTAGAHTRCDDGVVPDDAVLQHSARPHDRAGPDDAAVHDGVGGDA